VHARRGRAAMGQAATSVRICAVCVARTAIRPFGWRVRRGVRDAKYSLLCYKSIACGIYQELSLMCVSAETSGFYRSTANPRRMTNGGDNEQ
jgi:hypothetical protein